MTLDLTNFKDKPHLPESKKQLTHTRLRARVQTVMAPLKSWPGRLMALEMTNILLPRESKKCLDFHRKYCRHSQCSNSLMIPLSAHCFHLQPQGLCPVGNRNHHSQLTIGSFADSGLEEKQWNQ
jgi:hypothetical protein